ncbi:MAG TPA: AraC family transcriptional regulator [Burkholderiaceae bacterium]|nr:AraC family transcriptional regulator [Burkholderiaceae bacterium]
MAFVHGMLEGVVAQGHPVDGCLAQARIPPELLAQPGARVTVRQYVDLFAALIRTMGDDGLGFFSRPLRRGCMALIARSALDAPTLDAAIRRATRTFDLLQDDVRARQAREGTLAGLALELTPAAPKFMHELLLRVFWRLFAWLAGGKLELARIDFAFAPPAYREEYDVVFPAPLRFACGASAFWFDARQLNVPIRQDADSLRAFLRDVPSAIVMPRWSVSTSTSRVRVHLQSRQPVWPDLAETATALGMSTATLQRRLVVEHTSFQKVKDELRRDVAVVRLNAAHATLAEIAFELGFADSAAFQRAFKGWTGSAPGSYRQRQAGE